MRSVGWVGIKSTQISPRINIVLLYNRIEGYKVVIIDEGELPVLYINDTIQNEETAISHYNSICKEETEGLVSP